MNLLRRLFGSKGKQANEQITAMFAQAVLQELSQPAHTMDMPRRVQLCQQTLDMVDRRENPQLWAALQIELGNSLVQNSQGPRAENLEQAIGCYEQALQVRTRQAMPSQWATTTMSLANAYYVRIRGERAENLEQAIGCYKQALQVMTRQAMPFQWAMTTMNLANAYYDRIRGERPANLEQAIGCYEQVLQVVTRQAKPAEWAMTITNLANAYRNRIRGERAANLEQAIELNEQALQVMTRQAMPFEWATTTRNLAIAYAERIRGERAENLEQAIGYYKQVLQVMTHQVMTAEWAMTTTNLASAYFARISGERAENLEQAIGYYKQVLQVMTRQAMPFEWATTTMNLGTVYLERIRGERADNLEQAIGYYKQVLQVMTRQARPIEWAITTTNLASAYADRIRGERAENMKWAIASYEQTLANVYLQEAFPDDHRHVQNSLGDLYFQQGAWAAAATAFASGLQAGENLYQTAATPEARQGELGKWRGVPMQLAYALLKSAPLDTTVHREAVLALERNRARWLSESLAVRMAIPGGVPDALWQRFVGLGQQIQALQAESRLPETTPAKRSYLVLTELLRTAYAELQETVEQIRTSAPDFMPDPSFADIQAAAQGAPLVYLLTTTAGGLALVVQAEQVTPVWLDALTEEKVHALLTEWFDAYTRQHTARQAWFDTMERITQRLWNDVMGPLATALHEIFSASPKCFSQERRVPSGRGGEVTLIPTGLLSLLPLHAAWTAQTPHPNPPQGEGTVTGLRRYFLDEFVVNYAPSARALSHAARLAQQVSGAQLLAVDEPKPVRGNDLPNSGAEVAAIADHFVQPQLFAHEQASRAGVLAALPHAQVAHFSCHGATNWENALDSGLVMAHDERLTVRNLLELQLPGARLATLSACETGIVGTDLPDEVVALPSALVQAGFAGVVASLWSVADISTAMLMARFYDFWQGDKLEPAHALRAAQRWVRDTTNREKAMHFRRELPTRCALRMPAGIAQDFFEVMRDRRPNARDFEHPFWWAAFYLTGV